MAKKINPLVLSYPTFTLGQIIDPEEVNQNNMDITNKVNEFVSEVETAISIAESADASSLNAINVANQSSTKSDSAVSTANNASNKSDNAVVVANNAQSVADNAKLTAENVQTDYNALKPSLTQAIVDAGNAVNIANSADGKANTALSNSNTAISTANSADGKANNAVTTSNQAKDVADSASIVANQAKGIAESTDIVADNAMNKATSVETDFNTLRPQLEQAVIDVNNAVVAVANKVDKSYVDDLVADIILGEIPDGSVTKQKLSTSLQSEIDDKLLLGITSTTAFQGDLGQKAYDHSLATHAPISAQKNSDITKAEIEAKLTGVINTHSHAIVNDPSKAPTNHASIDTSYGVGSGTLYGHIKLMDGTGTEDKNSGIAVTPFALKLVNDQLPGKAPTSHASSATTYGVGSPTLFGHVKTINVLTQSSHVDGNALSAFQGKVLNDAIATKAPTHQVGTTTPATYVGAGVLYGVY